MEPPPPDVFVRTVMAELGLPANKPTEFAKRIGLTKYESPKRVKAWLGGRNAPSYEPTMRMLLRVGWLTDEALERLAGAEKAAEKAAAEAQRFAAEQRPQGRRRPR